MIEYDDVTIAIGKRWKIQPWALQGEIRFSFEESFEKIGETKPTYNFKKCSLFVKNIRAGTRNWRKDVLTKPKASKLEIRLVPAL